MNVATFYVPVKGILSAVLGLSLLMRREVPLYPKPVVQPPSEATSSLRFLLGLPRPLAHKGEPNTPFCEGQSQTDRKRSSKLF